MMMEKICPRADVWHDAHKKLAAFAQINPCNPPQPPTPLILAGWAFSSDLDKKLRWDETVRWANNNSCSEIIRMIKSDDYYSVRVMTG